MSNLLDLNPPEQPHRSVEATHHCDGEKNNLSLGKLAHECPLPQPKKGPDGKRAYLINCSFKREGHT